MMTKFDWNEMKRAKLERREKEQKIKEALKDCLTFTGGLTVFSLIVAVLG